MDNPLIASDSVVLDITTADLLAKRLNIQQLLVGDTQIRGKVARNGKSDLEAMFDSPAAAGPTGEIDALPSLREAAEQTSAEAKEVNPAASGIALTTVADRIQLSRADISLLFEASDARIDLKDLKISLSELSIDPRGDGMNNTAAFAFASDLLVGNAALSEEFFVSHISGNGNMLSLDVSTGTVNPSLDLNLTVHQGARINTFPVVAKIKDLLSQIEVEGVDLGDIQLGGELLADASTRLQSVDSKITFLEPLPLELSDLSLEVNERSWINTATNTHKLKGTIIASEKLTAEVESRLKIYLKEKAGGFYNDTLADVVLSPVKRDGRLAFDFSSTGDMRDPDADVVTPFGNLGDMMESGKKTLNEIKGVLKGFFQ